MKKFSLFTTLTLVIFLISTQAYAKWWIFGQSQDEIAIPYLYINNISFDEGGEEITLYKQYLEEGNVVIKGKASLKKGNIGSVQISTNAKETWQKAELAKDGAFVFKFKPEAEKTYEIFIKILTTSGKSNDVDDTRKVLTVSSQDMRAAVSEVLDKLTEAYISENPTGFMQYISDDFDGDFTILDRAIRKDFSLFDNIDIRFVLNSIASGTKGRIYVTVTFNRFLTGARDGQSYSDRGMTEFSFVSEGKGLKVKSMKNPIIFGLSDAANVGTGTSLNGLDDDVITVDPRGQISIKPFSDAINDDDDDDDQGGDQNGIPTPTNLRVVGGMKHHFIELEFDSVLTMDDLIAYETIIEEAFSPSGPWTEALRKPGDTYAQFTTDAIAQEAAILYYRARLSRDGAVSAPTNVIAWDNN